MKEARLPLEHIREAMRFLVEHVQAKADVERNTVLRYAVERNLAVIGEAAKRVPESYRQAHPEVPWGEMAGMRDVIIHEYDLVDLDEMWSTIEKDIPDTLKTIERLLQDETPSAV